MHVCEDKIDNFNSYFPGVIILLNTRTWFVPPFDLVPFSKHPGLPP